MQVSNRHQGGIALLVFIIFIALAAITYYFSTISHVEQQINQQQKTAEALKQAKVALIEYALVNSYVNSPSGELGKLPCPDYNGTMGEGVQVGNCGLAYANAMGLFPWKEVGINVLKDSSGTCLLYAVSPAYKSSPPAALNPDSYGQFNILDSTGAVISGYQPEDRPVAVIFAPGGALSGQSRNNNSTTFCGGDYGNISAYLDNNNSAINAGNNVIDTFVQATPDSKYAANPVNDRLITISYSDIWKPLLAALNRDNFFAINGTMYKVTEALSMCMAAYGKNNGNHLPMPAALDLNSGEYRKDVDYDDGSNFSALYAGRFPYDTSHANTKLAGANAQYLLDNAYCDHLDLASTAAVEDIMWSNSEYRQLWSNWKDYFFYAVSKAYNPTGSAIDCSAGCVSVGGVDYAAIVFFSGLKTGSQQRYSRPFDVDDKANISNYLEEGRDTQFPDNAGAGAYPSVTAASNDIMFCIKTDMSVVPCS